MSLFPADESPLISRLSGWAWEFAHETAYTFVDYGTDPAGVATHLTWAELDRRARAVAAALRETSSPGDRAAILAPQSLDYLVAFFGCLYARVVAVPLFSPDLPGHADRLTAVYRDAEPSTVITTSVSADHVETFLDEQGTRPKGVLLADRIGDAQWADEPIRPDDIAYLQYTSGSTRVPAGVVITHRNLTANAVQLHHAGQGTPRTSSGVSWLPLFHDMGLVFTAALPLVHANPCLFMDPVAFVMRPLRWLELLSTQRDVYTAGPNFAYEYLTRHVTDEEKQRLDLSGVRMLLNGAEPIRPATLEGFFTAFAGCGLRAEAQSPAYGLAEATVYVTACSPSTPPTTVAFDRAALAAGVARPADGGTALVSCGAPFGQHVAVVDPDGRALPDGRVGELWVHGANVAAGYWGRADATEQTFRGVLADPPDGLPAKPWLRTGDLGFRHAGEYYVTGRIKDLIIIDGRNHYPQDVEHTAAAAHPGVRAGYVTAFADASGGGERLVVVAERNRRVPVRRLDRAAVADAVRGAVQRDHGLTVDDFVLVEPGSLPRTSSGKLTRTACRDAYRAGRFR
ncbi:fatty acyl-AMP ligase [Actinomadura rayongensis]|uniref:AMP-binding protein n=1 Tax=Actinomadura rayongensis TaxID=1429076 RepID=A0A6I4W4Z9_9ACTN|nr:fatty acyl-AMP ligase [Actinomadura rayongensis]MXQ65779.1 AMP-binding protein [Actinomadura rayongensis]